MASVPGRWSLPIPLSSPSPGFFSLQYFCSRLRLPLFCGFCSGSIPSPTIALFLLLASCLLCLTIFIDSAHILDGNPLPIPTPCRASAVVEAEARLRLWTVHSSPRFSSLSARRTHQPLVFLTGTPSLSFASHVPCFARIRYICFFLPFSAAGALVPPFRASVRGYPGSPPFPFLVDLPRSALQAGR